MKSRALSDCGGAGSGIGHPREVGFEGWQKHKKRLLKTLKDSKNKNVYYPQTKYHTDKNRKIALTSNDFDTK